MIRWEIKVGFKEIAAVAIAIPAVYEKIRKLKLKYDIKEEKQLGPKGNKDYIFGDCIIDSDGNRWRKEV